MELSPSLPSQRLPARKPRVGLDAVYAGDRNTDCCSLLCNASSCVGGLDNERAERVGDELQLNRVSEGSGDEDSKLVGLEGVVYPLAESDSERLLS